MEVKDIKFTYFQHIVPFMYLNYVNMHVCIFRTHNGDLKLFVFFVVTKTYEQLICKYLNMSK